MNPIVRSHPVRIPLFASLALCLSAMSIAPAFAAEWPFWRGPEQNGVSREHAPVTKWTIDGENQLWRTPVGGRSTPLIMQGRVFVIGPMGEGQCLRERVVCMEAATGKVLWEYPFNVFHTDVVENRLGWTSLAGDPQSSNVYAHGSGGELIALDRDGKVLWKHSLTEEYSRFSGYGGRLQNPIVDEERVIISFLNGNWGNQAKSSHRYVAFDKRSGKVQWWAEPGIKPEDTTQAAPVVSVIDGRRLLIAPNADGWVYAMNARTGESVWKFHAGKRGLNSTPVVAGRRVYISHGEENLDTTAMGRLVCINASAGTGDITKKGEVWRVDEFKGRFSSPAILGDRLYICDDIARLYCFDAKTGKQFWMKRLGRTMKASPTITADGIIYIGEVNGQFYILKDAGDHCEILDKKEFKHPKNFLVDINGCASVSDGRVYFMTRYDTYCLGPKDVPPVAAEAVVAVPMTDENPPDLAKPGVLQIFPADVTLAPSEQVEFKAKLYDEGGHFITTPDAQWTIDPSLHGVMMPDGTFRADPQPIFTAGLVTAKDGTRTAVARVRISPRVPVSTDFDKMKSPLPPGWVGVGGRSKLVKMDGGQVLQKLADNPWGPFVRMECFSGPPILAENTVQADMMGKCKPGKDIKPDMGLINCRYELILLNNGPSLRIVSWAAPPRLQKDVPFAWKPDVWYRVKLRVDIKKDRTGWIRGKVWPRDQKEPTDWQIDVTDPCPNYEGSPGLYAYSNGVTEKSPGATSFYDNYKVIPND